MVGSFSKNGLFLFWRSWFSIIFQAIYEFYYNSNCKYFCLNICDLCVIEAKKHIYLEFQTQYFAILCLTHHTDN